MIKANDEVRDVAKAERWLPKMLDAGVEADTIRFDAMIKACAEARDVSKAEQ